MSTATSPTPAAPQYTAPPALEPRTRSLTPPFDEPGNISPRSSSSTTPIHIQYQTQSPLFSTLPPEIRHQIFREVVADQVISLFLEPRPPHTLRLCDCSISPEVDLRLPIARGGWIGLLQSCRRIYSETIDLIYSANTFYAHNEFTLTYLGNKIPASRYQKIKSVHLKTFCPSPRHTHVPAYGDLDPSMEVWGVLARMKGLEKLTIEMGGREWMEGVRWWDGTDVRAWTASEAFFLQRLDVIKQVKDLRLLLSWPQGIHPMEAVVPLCQIERRWPPAEFWDFPRQVE